ncbi:uncharacterized protein MYCFIDRAFT_197566 [Pseudocercospora fijiensis CIRAD86]|uniref:Uncharacterized protein n=1 Tax=Pseudocercospora fijiensis (strain CIRAD86) TaxID=383855 RepID=M3AD19_PSEFD|nr:uncharacterized protein MYCFIDRAFT_197566 [Pseudocercospora fijiensis CIRAD86]EME82446.1 hypothetical protein MYCFIDRAFT_197566 [Pseudocercospora fijiensis CIRAD86]
MGKYNFKLAKQVLTDGEKDRILAIYLNTNDGVIDWATATSDFGAASAESMKVSLRNTMKKLDKSAVGEAPESEDPPAETATKGKKRKAAPAEGEETKGKKRGRKAKKEVAAEESAEVKEETE